MCHSIIALLLPATISSFHLCPLQSKRLAVIGSPTLRMYGGEHSDMTDSEIPAKGMPSFKHDESIQWQRTAKGLRFLDDMIGTGPVPSNGDVVNVHYTVSLLESGTTLGSSRNNMFPLTFALGRHKVPIWDDALHGMNIGGKRRLVVPYEMVPLTQLANVPGQDRTLRFDFELVGMETGPMAAVAWLWPPGTRRIAVIRILWTLSFIPYFLPVDMKPDCYKVKDQNLVQQHHHDQKLSKYLGGDGSNIRNIFPFEESM